MSFAVAGTAHPPGSLLFGIHYYLDISTGKIKILPGITKKIPAPYNAATQLG
jgi:hypothetical protein